MRAHAVFALLVWLAGVTIACSSEDTGTTPGLTKSTPQFRKDIIPILDKFCATSACHATEERNLGITLKIADPAAVYAELKKESPTAKGTPFVTPGDPKKSFLQAKIDGNQADFEASCLLLGCGEIMPPGSKLTTSQRDTFRAWITAGAKDD
jgi:hypothetical protein